MLVRLLAGVALIAGPAAAQGLDARAKAECDLFGKTVDDSIDVLEFMLRDLAG